MMDRHLIYPPGWDKRSKKSEWDADPSLKGKPIPIQGTNLILDKPEDLEAWLAERKRRWPTADRVDEKKRKTEEALSRGQLPDTLGRRPNKRQRTGESGSERGRGRERGRGQPSRGRGARPTDSGWQGRAPKTVPSQDLHALSTLSSTSQAPVAGSISDDNSEDEDEGSPEVISSKAPVDPLPSVTDCNSFTTTETAGPKRNSVADRQFKRPPPQPRKEVFNPFASRPTLLRNLLIPEIRMTISNLSQAIRFLVDNDFLEGVEGTPGDADCKMIQVIDEESTKE
ncbi:hypothetical protein H0H81_007514 [Sphagnurus paluster]|uniref:FMR1-interacting protein 1 conserved domain-containing protein n=1 Tax=Sphagnurus paluster TaxID=117069 RepID=A0A9P7GVE0_9AGAR|nr:hypothetical protein H0H81_007514 [Sphagnurus paluster]